MRKNTFIKWVLVVLVGFLGFGNVNSQILTFDFASLGGSEITASSNSNNANLTASTISRGAGLTASGNSGRFNATNWALTSIDNAVSGNKYMEFTITPNSGFQFSVSSIVIQLQRSSTGPSAIALRNSTDSYASNLDAIYSIADNTNTQTITFTFAQAASTSAVTYRLYMYAEATTGSGGPGDGTGNDIVVNGTVESAGGALTVSNPIITPSGIEKATDNYFETAQISLSTSTEGASIYYTLNGDDPTTSSTLYSAPFSITETKTIKAIGVKAESTSSAIVSKTVTISSPANGTVPYTEAFNNTLGDWYSNAVSGAKPWLASANGAYANGFNGGTVESWLISPRFTVDADGLELSFNYASRYIGNSLIVKASTNYTGYGSPASATWVDLATILAPTVQDNAYTVKYSGKLPFTTVGNVHFALYYAASSNWSDWRITNVSIAEPTLSPTILVTEISIPSMSSQINLTDNETFTVNGSNLTGDITLNITGTDASLFTLSSNAITPASGSVVDQVITVTYSPVSAGSHTATLTLSSSGAEDVTRTLSGSATNPPVLPDVIISEVYGGGGNSGATLINDFVELYNTTESSVSIAGWSIQYYSATGTGLASNVFEIPAGKYIPAKNYFLVQCAAGTGGTENLLAPDAVSILSLSGTAGKIILYTTNTPQTITTDVTSITGNISFKDYVPYGTTAIPVLGAASAAPTNTTSLSRKSMSGAYVYTQNIANDFEVIATNPQSSGLTTGLHVFETEKIQILDGKIFMHAVSGQTIEVYNSMGQRLINHHTTDGLNILNPQVNGMVIVKSVNQIIKLIL